MMKINKTEKTIFEQRDTTNMYVIDQTKFRGMKAEILLDLAVPICHFVKLIRPAFYYMLVELILPPQHIGRRRARNLIFDIVSPKIEHFCFWEWRREESPQRFMWVLGEGQLPSLLDSPSLGGVLNALRGHAYRLNINIYRRKSKRSH